MLSRLLTLDEVQRAPGRDIEAIASAVGLHVNTARDHLATLEDEGLVFRTPIATGRRGRPPVVYRPVTDVEQNPAARQYLALARRESRALHHLAPETDRSAALGDDAARQFDAVETHLADAGLGPVVAAGGSGDDGVTIALSPCHYGAAIDADIDAVCAVHERLIRTTLEQTPGPMRLGGIEPFVEPGVCRLRLRIERPAARA